MPAQVETKSPPALGLYVFAAAALFLGLIGLFGSDFAGPWQRVAPGIPFRLALARLAALIEIGAGLALLWPRTRRPAAALLTALYSVFVLLWIPTAVVHTATYDGWGNVFEELSTALGAAILFTASPRRARLLARLYGLCPISFAIVHFIVLRGTASWVPRWLPPSQMFWAVATAVCFLLAAAALLSGVLAGLAARLLTVEILLFGVLVWIPKLLAAPHIHIMWAGNAINFAIAASAWVVSDVFFQPPAAITVSHPAHPQAILERIDEHRTKTAV